MKRQRLSLLIDRSQSFEVSAPIWIHPRRNTTTNDLVRARASQQQRLIAGVNKQRQEFARTIRDVENANVYRRLFNDRIYDVLQTATGQQLPSNPHSWWFPNRATISLEGTA